MAFDVADLLENLFGGPAAKVALELVAIPEAVPRCQLALLGVDDDGGGRFADWVRRPDCHGRMGWESPGLPESDRWWARCDFDDLPEVPVGFSIGELPKPPPQDSHGRVAAGLVDTRDLGHNRPLQQPLEGFVRV
jgi:hypothetical protein